MQSIRHIIALLALGTVSLSSTAHAVTILNDNFSKAADWAYLPSWAKGDIRFKAEGITFLLNGDKPFQIHTLRYIGPGYFRSNPEAHQSFNWFGNPGPITYSFTLASIPSYSTAPNKPGYTISLVLVCNDPTPYSDPAAKAPTALVLKIEDVGPRPAVNNQNQFVAQIAFKVDSPNKAVTQDQRILRFSNDQPNIMPTPTGTWSFTIDGDEIWITNCLGERSDRAKLPSDLVRAHAADNASLYLTVSNGYQPPGPVTISRVNVAPVTR
jgi:hypothetical protein